MEQQRAVVDVNSAWWSKINWTQVVGIVSSILVIVTGGKLDLSVELQAQIVLAIQAITGLITIVLKTFFTTTITKSSAKMIEGDMP